jgi:hypothetical protein
MKTISAHVIAAALLVACAASTEASASGAAVNDERAELGDSNHLIGQANTGIAAPTSQLDVVATDGKVIPGESTLIGGKLVSVPEIGTSSILAENTVPELSSGLQLLSGLGVLLLVRRRK